MLSFEKVLEAIPERVRMRLFPVTFEPVKQSSKKAHR